MSVFAATGILAPILMRKLLTFRTFYTFLYCKKKKNILWLCNASSLCTLHFSGVRRHSMGEGGACVHVCTLTWQWAGAWVRRVPVC